MNTTIKPPAMPPRAWLAKQMDRYSLAFGLEITAAVLLKFLLLWALWWLFFAGQKQPVNAPIIAEKLFGISNPLPTERAIFGTAQSTRLRSRYDY